MSLECSICEGDARAGCDCWERVRALEASGMSRKQAVAQVSGVAAPDAPRPVRLAALLLESNAYEGGAKLPNKFTGREAGLLAEWLAARGGRVVPPGAVVVDPEGEIPEAVVTAALDVFWDNWDKEVAPEWYRGTTTQMLRAALRAWPKGA